MNKFIFKRYTGFCPRFCENRTIRIQYAVISMQGQPPGYKKMSFTCDDGTDCPHLDQKGRCPLLIDAPDKL